MTLISVFSAVGFFFIFFYYYFFCCGYLLAVCEVAALVFTWSDLKLLLFFFKKGIK